MSTITHTATRPANRDDIPALVALKTRAAAIAYEGHDGLDAWMEHSCAHSWFAYRIGRVAYRVHVAIVDGQIVGYCGYRVRGERADGHSVGLYIDPSYQGQGIGTQLAALREAEARDEGCTSMRVAVWRTNDAARSMMQARGFERLRSFRESTVGVMIDYLEKSL